MSTWNPHAPDSIGLEWLPVGHRDGPVAAQAQAQLQYVTAAATELVDTVWVWMSRATGPLLLEVYEQGQETAAAQAAVTTTTYTSDTFVDNHNATILGGTYAYNAGTNSNVSIGLNFSTLAEVSAAERILSSGIYVQVGDSGFVGVGIALVSALGGFIYYGPATTSAGLGQWYGVTGEMAPGAAGLFRPLTAAVLRELSTGAMWLQVGLGDYTDGINTNDAVCALQTVAENRLAMGVATSSDGPGWVAVPVARPNGEPWVKEANQTYAIVLRQPLVPMDYLGLSAITEPATAWRGVTGGPPPNQPLATSALGTVNSAGLITDIATPTGSVVRSYRLASSGQDQVESQPYIDAAPVPFYLGVTFRQRIAVTETGPYSALRLVLSAAGQPLGQMYAQILDGNGDVVADAAISPDDVAALPPLPGQDWGFGVYQADFQPFEAQAGITYTVILGSTSPATNPWLVAEAVGDSSAPATLASSYGGAGGGAADIFSGAIGIPGDLAVTMVNPPETPGGLSAVASSWPIAPLPTAASMTAPTPQTGDPPGCLPAPVVPAGIGYAALAWQDVALGQRFGSYQLQRYDAADGGWVLMQEIDTEATLTFDDGEVALGQPAQYRIRSVRNPATWDGVASAWSEPVTVLVGGGGAELTFTSNEEPSIDCGYFDVTDATTSGTGLTAPVNRPWEFPDAAGVVYKQLYGVDYQRRFVPTEQRGVTLTVTLMVSALLRPARPGLAVFDALRALTRAPLSYVAVRDSWGNRLYAGLTVPGGNAAMPRHRYSASITITQITDTPTTGPFVPPPPGLQLPNLIVPGASSTLIPMAAIPDGDINDPYTVELTCAGGKAPFSWTLTAGQLPPGLAITPDAQSASLTGQPTTLGTFGFSLHVVDANKAAATATYSVRITDGAVYDDPSSTLDDSEMS